MTKLQTTTTNAAEYHALTLINRCLNDDFAAAARCAVDSLTAFGPLSKAQKENGAEAIRAVEVVEKSDQPLVMSGGGA